MSRTWDNEIKLFDIIKGLDDAGYETVREVQSETLLANKLNVHSQEFWLAKQNVVRLENVFEIHEIEYGGERGLYFNGAKYKIERTYLNKDGYLELTTSLWSDEHGTND